MTKTKRKTKLRSEKEDIFIYLDNNAKFSAQQNNDANRSLIGAIFSQAYDDFIYLSKHEVKPIVQIPSKRKKFIKNVDKQDRLETSIDFLDKDNPLFIYYCELLDFEPDWVCKKIYARIKNYYINKGDIYLKKKGFKKKKKIPLPVENINSQNLYCADRAWKNVNSECPHGKQHYCEPCLDELPEYMKAKQEGATACLA